MAKQPEEKNYLFDRWLKQHNFSLHKPSSNQIVASRAEVLFNDHELIKKYKHKAANQLSAYDEMREMERIIKSRHPNISASDATDVMICFVKAIMNNEI